MARLPRLALPGHVHHVVQAGTQLAHIFSDDGDRLFALDLLAHLAHTHRVAIHGYALLPDRFHLLLTPGEDTSLPLLMQGFGRAYVPHHNRRHQRSGTLWGGRYRSTVVQPERYVLSCLALIDWLPVAAGVAAEPAAYPWSSHGHHAGRRNDRLVTPHPLYWALGNTPFAREAAYVQRVGEGVSESERSLIERSTQAGWALGDAGFVASLQQQTARRLSRARAGRPRKAD